MNHMQAQDHHNISYKKKLKVKLRDVYYNKLRIHKEIKKNRLNIFIFIDHECPISQKYTKIIKDLEEKYKRSDVAMYGIFPYQSANDVEIFSNKYKFKFPNLLDGQGEMTKILGATITPEVFLIDKQGFLIYQGKIDNWFYELGRYRQVITEHYLEDAITAYNQGNEVAVKKTEAIGCLIGAVPHMEKMRH